MYLIVIAQSTCPLHVSLCTKCEFSPFWNGIFTIKMRGESRFILKNGDLWLKLCPIKSKVNLPPKIAKLLQFQKSVSPTVFYGCWSLLRSLLQRLNICSCICNAWWTRLETSSGRKLRDASICALGLSRVLGFVRKGGIFRYKVLETSVL